MIFKIIYDLSIHESTELDLENVNYSMVDFWYCSAMSKANKTVKLLEIKVCAVGYHYLSQVSRVALKETVE